MSAAERVSKASSVKQAYKWAVQANKRMDEQVAQYFCFWLIWPTVLWPTEEKDGDEWVQSVHEVLLPVVLQVVPFASPEWQINLLFIIKIGQNLYGQTDQRKSL